MRFRLKDHHNGCCIGELEIPTAAHASITVAAIGDDRADALAKAAVIAERIAQDPIMSALLPPQALAAIKAAKGLSAAAKRGTRTLKRFWGRLRGPGKKRLAEALHRDAQVADLELGFVEPHEVGFGIRSLFKKKRKKKRARMMSRPREREPEEPEDEQPEDSEEQSEETSDVADDNVGDVAGAGDETAGEDGAE